MTVLAPEADMRGLADEDLAALFARADETEAAGILAEMSRRDRLEADRRRRDGQRGEWLDGAWAQYQEAIRECNGYLLNRRGIAAGVDEWSLWSGPESRVAAYGSEELRNYLDTHPRVTVTSYRDQIAAGHRARREETERAAYAAGNTEDDVSIIGSAVRDTARAAELAGRMAAARQRAEQRVAARAAEMNGSSSTTTVAVRDSAAVAARPPAVDGATVLDYACQFIGRYARLSPAATDAAVLWAAHAHARDADGTLVWDASGRLMFLSSEPGSGKSRALELTGMLCPQTYGLDTEPSEAGLTYSLGREKATVLLDEGDVLFASGKRKAAVRAILNAGYTRSGTVLRMRGGKGERVPVFGPVAMAALDVVQKATGDTLAPLFSRSIIIRMRKSPDPVRRLDREGRQVGAMLCTALGTWAASVRGDLTSARPEVPEWLMNRAEEIWTPLLAIAEAVGGDWPERALRAAEELALNPDIAESAEDQAVMMDDLAGMIGSWGEE